MASDDYGCEYLLSRQNRMLCGNDCHHNSSLDTITIVKITLMKTYKSKLVCCDIKLIKTSKTAKSVFGSSLDLIINKYC